MYSLKLENVEENGLQTFLRFGWKIALPKDRQRIPSEARNKNILSRRDSARFSMSDSSKFALFELK
jgi:hypothetical protein